MNDAPENSPPIVTRRLYDYDETGEPAEADFLFDAPGVEALASFCAGIVLASGDETRAMTLLAAGAPIVFVGEAALRDAEVIGRLVARHGSERIGVYAPARRMPVSWAFETVSNADFKTVAPSACEPAWEVLTAAGEATGTLLRWWLAALRDLGATQFLVSADIADDSDLNICAGLNECFAGQLWIAPRSEAPSVPLDDWIVWGRCRQLALPPDLAAALATDEAEIPCAA